MKIEKILCYGSLVDTNPSFTTHTYVNTYYWCKYKMYQNTFFLDGDDDIKRIFQGYKKGD